DHFSPAEGDHRSHRRDRQPSAGHGHQLVAIRDDSNDLRVSEADAITLRPARMSIKGVGTLFFGKRPDAFLANRHLFSESTQSTKGRGPPRSIHSGFSLYPYQKVHILINSIPPRRTRKGHNTKGGQRL